MRNSLWWFLDPCQKPLLGIQNGHYLCNSYLSLGIFKINGDRYYHPQLPRYAFHKCWSCRLSTFIILVQLKMSEIVFSLASLLSNSSWVLANILLIYSLLLNTLLANFVSSERQYEIHTLLDICHMLKTGKNSALTRYLYNKNLIQFNL